MEKFRISVKGQIMEAHDSAKVRGCENIHIVSAKPDITILTVKTSLEVLVEWFCETDLLEGPHNSYCTPTSALLFYINENTPEGNSLVEEPTYLDRMFKDTETFGSGGIDSIPLVMAKPVGFGPSQGLAGLFCHCQWPCNH